MYFKICSFIYTEYVVTEYEGHINMGQYYSS